MGRRGAGTGSGTEGRRTQVIRKIEARGAIEMAKRVKNHCSEIFQYGIAEGKCRRDRQTNVCRIAA
jgi:hypothetical protein